MQCVLTWLKMNEYQKINNFSRNTASAELEEIENNHNLLINKGYGAGSFCELIAQ